MPSAFGDIVEVAGAGATVVVVTIGAVGVIVAAFESTAVVSVAHHTLYAVPAVRPVHASENDDPPV